MYRMNEATITLLERVQERLSSTSEEVQPEARGAFAMDEATVSHLEKIRAYIGEEEDVGGEGGADNEPNIDDAFNLYLDGIADSLIEMGYSEDEAISFVLDVADEMAAEGVLPPMPAEDALEDEVAVWLGTANTVGFANEVLSAAE